MGYERMTGGGEGGMWEIKGFVLNMFSRGMHKAYRKTVPDLKELVFQGNRKEK